MDSEWVRRKGEPVGVPAEHADSRDGAGGSAEHHGSPPDWAAMTPPTAEWQHLLLRRLPPPAHLGKDSLTDSPA